MYIYVYIRLWDTVSCSIYLSSCRSIHIVSQQDTRNYTNQVKSYIQQRITSSLMPNSHSLHSCNMYDINTWTIEKQKGPQTTSFLKAWKYLFPCSTASSPHPLGIGVSFGMPEIHPGRLTWNPKMMVWKMIFLSNRWSLGSMSIFRGVLKNVGPQQDPRNLQQDPPTERTGLI